jgi:hypothetical protein
VCRNHGRNHVAQGTDSGKNQKVYHPIAAAQSGDKVQHYAFGTPAIERRQDSKKLEARRPFSGSYSRVFA